MKNLLLLFVTACLLYGCSSVPLTGRQQLSLVSDQEVLSLSLQQYDDYIKTAQKSTDKANSAMVLRVGEKISNAVAAYYKANGMESLLSGYSWEFSLIKDPQVNAFCMPGGKIVVYEGILPYTQSEAGLAVVVGHEVAHAVAKHANERMSQQMVAQYGGAAVGGLLSKSSSAVQTIGNTVFGLGTQLGVMLPYSRKQEYEADYLGLVFMSMAGYNPSEAATFWQRMSTKGNSTSDFMSTHPSDEKRISEIQKHLPEVMQYYNGNGQIQGKKSAPTTKTQSKAKTDEKWKF